MDSTLNSILPDGEGAKVGEHFYKVSQSMLQGRSSRENSQSNSKSNFSLPLKSAASILLAIGAIRFPSILARIIMGGVTTLGTLLSLMYLSRSFQQYVVSMFQPAVMKGLHKDIREIKKELLKGMKGSVLDFGCGDGLYIRDIANAKDVTSVMSLEPNANLHENIRITAEKYGVTTEIYPKFSSQLLAERGEELFDFVIIGNVLCEVPNQESVLDDVYRLLKPEGIVYFVEHVACVAGSETRQFQDMINPLWKTVSGGCNCNRETLKEIWKKKWQLFAWEVKTSGPWFINRIHLGLAMKPKVGTEARL
uniref:Methyltransferase type 11 domain-containing protein n=1 Tax=Aplanochytrium stocchinoi TaxID=215587 RepID=A0A6S8DKB0_9STRA|mmetsp:Transcript_7899/g.9390  ORF Transcript_7899/g.9390 Transcript_7899/m.9390 type:complete len:308 (-) Transcript_7899:1158-2081(-)